MENINNNEEIIEDLKEEVEEASQEAVEESAEEVVEENATSEEVAEDDEMGSKITDKIKNLKKDKKDKKDEKIEELQDRLVRNMAEFDNFRKRTEKEKSAMFEIGAKSIIEKLLPVIDNFERGFVAASDEEKESPFYQGMDKIYKQLMTNLDEAGVKAIEAVGQEFNPDLHNAVMHCEDENYGENIISEEFQKGYMYKETVVRHSMVKVAN